MRNSDFSDNQTSIICNKSFNDWSGSNSCDCLDSTTPSKLKLLKYVLFLSFSYWRIETSLSTVLFPENMLANPLLNWTSSGKRVWKVVQIFQNKQNPSKRQNDHISPSAWLSAELVTWVLKLLKWSSNLIKIRFWFNLVHSMFELNALFAAWNTFLSWITVSLPCRYLKHISIGSINSFITEIRTNHLGLGKVQTLVSDYT